MFLETHISAFSAAAASRETCVQPLQCTPLLLTLKAIVHLTCWHEQTGPVVTLAFTDF